MYLSIFMSSLEVWLLPAVKFNPINNKLSQLRLYGLFHHLNNKALFVVHSWSLSTYALFSGRIPLMLDI